jgi:hypothetical protein
MDSPMTRAQKQWTKNLFMVSSLSHQKRLIDYLSSEARQAYLIRDYARQKIIGEKLMEASSHSEEMGRYFLVLAMKRQSKESHELARKELGFLIECPIVQASAMIAYAGAGICLNDSYRFTEKLLMNASAQSLKSGDVINFIQAQSMYSALLSNNSDHRESLRILRGLQPIIEKLGSLYEVVISDFNNSVAYELAQLGKHEEAKGFINISLNSPHLAAYPEWLETAREVYGSCRLKTLSFRLGGISEQIAYKKKPSNVLQFKPRIRQTAACPLVLKLPQCELPLCDYPVDKFLQLQNFLQSVTTTHSLDSAK